MEKQRKAEKMSIISLVQMGLMIALIYVTTSVIKIPIRFSPFGVNNLIHAGDSMVLISAVILGKRKGAIASALGMVLFDVLSGYIIWAPFTLAIKALVALVAAMIIEGFMKIEKEGKGTMIGYLIAFIAAELVMVIGYFIAGIIIGLITVPEEGLKYIATLEIINMGANIFQGAIGILIALLVVKILKKNKFI